MNQEQSNQEQILPTNLSMVIPVSQDMTAKVRLAGATTLAEAFEIDSPEMAQLAASYRTQWAAQIDIVKAARDEFNNPLKKFMKEYDAKWFAPPLADYETGRALLGAKVQAWMIAERERVAREKAFAEECARKTRQEAEREAAAVRARADEAAAAERRRAAEAEQRRLEAVAAGDKKAAEKAAADVAKAAERAAAVQENAAAKAAQVMVEAAASAPQPVAEAAKIAGTAMRENWVAKLKPGVTEEQALAQIVAAAAGNPQLLGLLKLDMSALNKLAKALKKAMDVPGYVAEDEPILAGKRK